MLLDDLLSFVLGLVSTNEVRHVADTGDDGQDGSEKNPYRTIAKALATPRTADVRIVVKLHGTKPFTESLNLPSDVTILGPGKIAGVGGARPITIAGTSTARVSGVTLRDVELAGSTTGTLIGLGGVVLIDRADRVVLEKCTIRKGLAGRGGGVAVLKSTAVRIASCTVEKNSGGTPASALAGADLFTVTGNMVLPAGDGHGGGIYLEDSAAEIRECTVTENRAILFGGGIGVRNTLSSTTPPKPPSHKIEIADCTITLNQVSHGSLGALPSAARLHAPTSMGDPVAAAFADTAVPESKEKTALANLHGGNFESGLGGGIAVRHADSATRITGCLIGVTKTGPAPNLARRGGGIHLYFGASPFISGCTIAHNLVFGDGGGVGVDLFDPIFPPGETEDFGIHAVALIPRANIDMLDNAILDNYAVEDGGGIYATGGAKLNVKRGFIRRNGAGQLGGGVRVTYATRLYMERVTITDNRANVIPDKSQGGGGVAARNSNVHLEKCTLNANSVDGFAGGAIFFASMFEGGFGRWGFIENEYGRFDKIMEAKSLFDFHARVLRLVDCTGAGGNAATGDKGAGGFLYAVRTADNDKGGIEPMWIAIAGADTSLGVNISTHAGRKRGNVVIELSGKELSPGVPEDRVAIGREVPATGIPASTSAIPPIVPTPATAGPALCVLRDTTPAHDVVLAAYPGGSWFHGPKPVPTTVVPNVVPVAGGTVVKVNGTGFEDPSRVLIGPHEATVSSVTPTAITCTTVPAAVAATADVIIIGPSGAQGWLPGAVKLVVPPRITFMSALKGRAGDSITIGGRGMPIGTKVHFMFGTTAVEAVVTPMTADNQLIVTVPAAPTGFPSARVRATSPTGEQFTRPVEKAFVYLP